MRERTFVKSSYSPETPISGSCVEISAPVNMHTSSYSGGNGGMCVEIGSAYDNCVMIGDSKTGTDVAREFIHVSPEAFAAFAGSIAAREFADITA